jgi:hypothetical protein
MNAINALGNAALGWLDLLANRPSGAERFDLTRAGLITAVAYYFVIVAGLTVIDLAVLNLLTYDRVFVGVVFNSLPLLTVVIVTALTMRILRPDLSMNLLLVPVIYALTFRVLLGVPLGLAFGPLVGFTLLGVLGYMLYRGARDLPKFNLGISVAYALIGLVALVGPAEALHMLFA